MVNRKFRFNVIDAFIILIIVGAISLLVYSFIFGSLSTPKREKHDVECVFEITGISENYFSDKFAEGESVAIASSGKTIGKITAAPDRRPSVSLEYDESSGSLVESPVPGRIDCFVTFVGQAEKTENGYRFADTYIKVNDEISLLFGDTSSDAVCIRMTVLDN